MIQKYVNIISLSLLIFLVSCKSINDAKHTLSEADSLRVEGVLYNDSAAISSAVEALTPFRHLYPTDYAKANYYYGRLLREHGNQAEAMRCFIDASHTDSENPLFKRIGFKYRHIQADEYNMLGSIYCNSGIICHLAEDYPLSYTMFEKSAKQFLKANNFSAYNYALNDMALELAEQSKIHETLALIELIKKSTYNDSTILNKVLETKAILYRNIGQYDSAINTVNKLLSNGYIQPTELMIKAQSFSYLNAKDSALYYASQVMSLSNHYGDIYNALYILSNDDSTLTNRKLLELTSKRDDIHTFEVEAQKIRLARATQILLQDLYYKPNYKWIFFISSVFTFIILIAIIIWIKTKYWRRKQYKEVNKQKEQVKIYVIDKQNELNEITNKVNEEKLQINKLKELKQNHSHYFETILCTLNSTCSAFQQSNNIRKELCWNNYDIMCEVVNKHFYMIVNKLKATQKLNDKEIRLCVLVLIGGFSSKQMAELLYYGETGIRNFKSNTAKKLGTNGKNLRNFLIEMAIKGQLLPNE